MAKLSIQLYTLREESAKDFEGVLRFCSELGFDGVEFAGFHGHDKETIKGWLDQYHLVPTSAHVPVEEMQKDLDGVMEFHRFIGNKRIIAPFWLTTDEASVRELIETLKPISRTLKENGFDLYYHNHNLELAEIGGKCVLDRMLEEIGEEYLKLQVDTFWVHVAGTDPCEFLKAHSKNMEGVVHIKDGFDTLSAAPEQEELISEGSKEVGKTLHTTFTPCTLGRGSAPVAEVVKTAKELGLDWLVLENDLPFPDGFEDVKKGYAVLKALA